MELQSHQSGKQKVIKGKFVKFLVENRITDITEVKRFEEDDFSWDNTDNAFVKIT